MLRLFILTATRFAISILIILITLTIREKSIKEREKITPFECGFSPFKKARRPFSIRFFIVTLIFLIFDIEIALVLPIGILAKNNHITIWAMTAVIVIIVLLVGLLHEWKNGALNWVK